MPSACRAAARARTARSSSRSVNGCQAGWSSTGVSKVSSGSSTSRPSAIRAVRTLPAPTSGSSASRVRRLRMVTGVDPSLGADGRPGRLIRWRGRSAARAAGGGRRGGKQAPGGGWRGGVGRAAVGLPGAAASGAGPRWWIRPGVIGGFRAGSGRLLSGRRVQVGCFQAGGSGRPVQVGGAESRTAAARSPSGVCSTATTRTRSASPSASSSAASSYASAGTRPGSASAGQIATTGPVRPQRAEMCPRTALGLDWKNSSGPVRRPGSVLCSIARAVSRSPLALASSRAVRPRAGGSRGRRADSARRCRRPAD